MKWGAGAFEVQLLSAAFALPLYPHEASGMLYPHKASGMYSLLYLFCRYNRTRPLVCLWRFSTLRSPW